MLLRVMFGASGFVLIALIVGSKYNKIFYYFTKKPTNTLIYVNTALFALLHSYILQSTRGYPKGVQIHFVNRVNKIRVQI